MNLEALYGPEKSPGYAINSLVTTPSSLVLLLPPQPITASIN